MKDLQNDIIRGPLLPKNYGVFDWVKCMLPDFEDTEDDIVDDTWLNSDDGVLSSELAFPKEVS